MLQPLICGYGRAGRRHDRLLQAHGFTPAIVEPEIEQLKSEISRRHFFNLQSALSIDSWAFAVLCTPPVQHLNQIEKCLEVGLPVLCEKPLCDFGQLEQARELSRHIFAHLVMMAFNYRFNPDLLRPDKTICLPNIEIYSSHFRGDVPSWGILLDHVSHDLDILQWKYGDLVIETARVREDERKRLVLVFGHLASNEKMHFKIHDEATKYEKERVCHLTNSEGDYQISSNPVMFDLMYNHFLKGLHSPIFTGLSDGLKIQEYLEEANRLTS